MPSFTGIVSLPPAKNVPTFNSPNFNTATQSLTYGDALKSFLAYPQAQGKEQLVDTDISGTLNLYGDMNILGVGNYIQFPDLTQQSTAFVEANYAQLNTDNTFLSPFTNTFQGTNASTGLTAPIVVSNSQTTNKASFYIDDANNLDFTLYSNQADGGMTIRNAGGNSFTVAPLAPNNTATFSNPIATSLGISAGTLTVSTSGTNPNTLSTGNFQGAGSNLQTSGKLVVGGTLTVYNNNPTTPHWADITCPNLNLEISTGLAITTVGQTNQVVLGTSVSGLTVDDGIVATGAISGSQLTLSSGGNTSVLTTTASGLNVADPIVSTGQIAGNDFLVNASGQNPYSIYSNSVGGYGLVVANTTGGVGTLTLSNNSTTLTTLSSTTNGLVVNDPLTATSLTLSSGGNSTVLTTTGTGLAINDSITVSGAGTVTCDTLTSGFINTQNGDLFVGGESTLASRSNLSGTSIAAAGLYFGRNLEVGQNEFDIIAYNPTSANYLNIYGSNTTAISQGSVPIISLANGTAYKNGNEIATVNQIPSVPATYFTGQIVTSLGSRAPTASGGTFLLCNGTSYSSTTYPNLFAVIGTAYGTSASGGFLPNLVTKFCYGANNGTTATYANINGSVSGGSANYSLTQVPPHTHSNSVSNTNFYNGTSKAGNDTSNNYVVNQNSTYTTTTNNAGDNISSTAINIPTVPPYIVVSYFVFAN